MRREKSKGSNGKLPPHCTISQIPRLVLLRRDLEVSGEGHAPFRTKRSLGKVWISLIVRQEFQKVLRKDLEVRRGTEDGW